MAAGRHCIECGRRKTWFTRNYAGMAVEKALSPPQTHIGRLTLPGDSNSDFLCAECASKRTVECSEHGPVPDGQFRHGRPPRCSACDRVQTLKSEFEELLKRLNQSRCPPPQTDDPAYAALRAAGLEFDLMDLRSGTEGRIAEMSNNGTLHVGPVFHALAEETASLISRAETDSLSERQAGRLREIGTLFNEAGGVTLMQAAYYCVDSSNGLARRLTQNYWRGIGGWG